MTTASKNAKGRGIARTVVAGVCVAALVTGSASGLCACKETNVIKNIVHDQDSENVDHEHGDVQRVVAEDGRFTDEDTGLYEVAGKGEEHLPVNVVYVSKDPDTSLPVARFVYDKKSDNDTEASEEVAPEEEPQLEEQENQEEEQNNEQRSDNKPSKKPGKKKGKGDKGSKKGGSGDGGKGKKPAGSDDGDDADDEKDPQVYDTTGKEPEIPEVARVAAYGEMAVVVQMLGGTEGETPLVAADDELCDGKFSDVFADEGSADINAKAWKAAGGSYEPDVNQIVKAKPDTVLVYTDGVFTKKQKAKLARNDISVTVVPQLRSVTGILRAVETVAKMLDRATDGTSKERFEEYEQYHKDLLDRVQAGNFAGRYTTYKGVVYDADSASKPKLATAKKFTLLIDKWDYGASYKYKSAVSSAGAGVGLSTVGYRNSPASYYMGAAGVVNNAAAMDTNKQYAGTLAPTWQFNTSQLNPSEVNFTSLFASTIYDAWPNGFSKTTLARVDSSKNELIDNGFGTDTFPVAIFATHKMLDSFVSSSKVSNGLYHPFGTVKTKTGTVHGTLAGSTEIITTIDEDADLREGRALRVNPQGLFSSWIDGSVESCLESAWIADIPEFENEWEGSVKTEVKDFYKTFYRYDVKSGEVDDIIEGAES